MIILVDMDDVLADFDGHFLKLWRRKHPNEFYVPLEQMRAYKLRESYPEELHQLMDDVYYGKNFINKLPPIPGGKEALEEMVSDGHSVFICTAPLSKYKHCVREKYEWAEKNLGYAWTKRIILTKDKTLVYGNYLIDDNPKIEGIMAPEWEHVVFDKPYNRHVTGKKRLKNLKDWKLVLS